MVHQEPPPPPPPCAVTPTTSFDMRIWEELHLRSSSSISSPVRNPPAVDRHEHPLPPPSSSNPSCPRRNAKFTCASPRPPRLCSSTSASKRDIIPAAAAAAMEDGHHLQLQQLPVVKVIQTGSMSFTCDKLVVEFGRRMPDTSAVDAASVQDMDVGSRTWHYISPVRRARQGTRCKLSLANNKLPITAAAATAESSNSCTAHHDLQHASYCTSPRKSSSSAAIPFKWEEVPGKPKSYDEQLSESMDHANFKSASSTLQLPPKLLHSSSVNVSGSDTRYAVDLSRSRSQNSSAIVDIDAFTISGTLPIYTTSRSSTKTPVSARSIWHSVKHVGRRSRREAATTSTKNCSLLVLDHEHQPVSPRSTFFGSDSGSSSSSSSSSSSTSSCASSSNSAAVEAARCNSPEVQSIQTREGDMDDVCSQARSNASHILHSRSCTDRVDLGPLQLPATWRRKAAAQRLKDFVRKWGVVGSSRSKGSGVGAAGETETRCEMWEPTLATYFLHKAGLQKCRSMTTASGSAALLTEQLNSRKNEGRGADGVMMGEAASTRRRRWHANRKLRSGEAPCREEEG